MEEDIKSKNIVVKKVIKIVLKILYQILVIICLIVAAVIILQKVTASNKSIAGYRIFRVQTGSMIPKYNVGDVILVKENDVDKIKIGDDVTYLGTAGSTKGMLITHRVIDIENIDGKIAFHTKGIANNLEDPIIYGDQINGVVKTKMYILTLICMLLNNKYIFYFVGILPLTIYIFFRTFKGSYDKYEKKIERVSK